MITTELRRLINAYVKKSYFLNNETWHLVLTFNKLIYFLKQSAICFGF